VHYLVIDDRFRVPVFVFLELDPRRSGTDFHRVVRGVTLDQTGDSLPHVHQAGVRPTDAIGQDPERLDRFVGFPSDGHVRAAGFALIEPRYVGPSWEAYLSVFRPEGERPSKGPVHRPRPPAPRHASHAKRT
jgi:hypothetical protein